MPAEAARSRVAALLRGINVGGNNKVPMADLRDLLADLGCTDVTTYLQSGNAVFVPPDATRTATAALAGVVESAILARLDLDIRVRLTDGAELDAVVSRNPFGKAVEDPTRVHAVFLESAPDKMAIARLRAATVEPNECVVVGAVAYLHYPVGFHAKPVPIERALGLWATARNWRTVLELQKRVAG